jgi:c-di-GMP-binding flagellar brake protein YcgR
MDKEQTNKIDEELKKQREEIVQKVNRELPIIMRKCAELGYGYINITEVLKEELQSIIYETQNKA